VTGGIKSVDVTAAGQGYDSGPVTVEVAGGNPNATATATVSAADVVTGFTGVTPGSGYEAFKVVLSGGVNLNVTGNLAATAIASGAVGDVAVTDGGSGYSMPIVNFDYPDDPNGIQATGHVECVEATDCSHAPDATVSIASVIVDEPGSGYTTAPAVTIRNGTQYDPINFPEGTAAATAKATLMLSAVNVLGVRQGLHQHSDRGHYRPRGIRVRRHCLRGDRRRGDHRRDRRHPWCGLPHQGHEEVRRRPPDALQPGCLPRNRQVPADGGPRGQEVHRYQRDPEP
jgi:hypothetical protein